MKYVGIFLLGISSFFATIGMLEFPGIVKRFWKKRKFKNGPQITPPPEREKRTWKEFSFCTVVVIFGDKGEMEITSDGRLMFGVGGEIKTGESSMQMIDKLLMNARELFAPNDKAVLFVREGIKSSSLEKKEMN